MCDGDEIGGIFELATTAVVAVGQLKEAKAEEKASKFNAGISRERAISSRRKAQFDANIEREDAVRRISAQKAAFGKSGVSLTGSPLLVMSEQARINDQDISAILFSGEIEAIAFDRAAELDDRRAKTAKEAGQFGVGSTLLTGAGSAFKTFGSP
tara:strand:+ start:118 stop:582 length:465 start_codon:yes stop_codon:yes gene_type:complete